MRNNAVTAKTEKTKNESGSSPKPAKFSSEGANSSLNLNSVAGNLAVQRVLGGGIIQPKLTISQPDDPYEKEADRVADEVMRMPVGGTAPEISSISTSVQRMCAGCEEELEEKETAGASAVQRKMVEEGDDNEEDKYLQTKRDSNVLAAPKSDLSFRLGAMEGGGQPLPPSTRAYFELRFGKDFSGVRVHNDSEAARLADNIQARAFTVGQHVAFGPRQHSPETTVGQRLLAHELVHVVQQSSSGSLLAQRQENKEPASIKKTAEKGPILDAVEAQDFALVFKLLNGLWMRDLLSRIQSIGVRKLWAHFDEAKGVNKPRLRTAMRVVGFTGSQEQMEVMSSFISTVPADQQTEIVSYLQEKGITQEIIDKILQGPRGPIFDAVDEENFPRVFKLLNGLWMRHLLSKIESIGVARLRAHFDEAQGVNRPRLQVAMKVVGGFMGDSEQAFDSILPKDQIADIDRYLRINNDKICPPPAGPGKHPGNVSQTLIDRAMGKYAKIDKDPGEGCSPEPYIAGKTERVCTIGFGHQILGCTVLSRATRKRPTSEEINKVSRSRPPEFFCSCAGKESFDCEGPQGEIQVRSDAAAKAKHVNQVVPVDLDQAQFDALVDLALHHGSIPLGLLTNIKNYWCTDEGKNYVRGLYLKTALKPFPKAFAARRKYRVWPATSTAK